VSPEKDHNTHFYLKAIPLSDDLTKCYNPKEIVENCATYDYDIQANSLVKSKSSLCKSCANKATHYLDIKNNKCMERGAPQMQNCETPSDYDNSCDKCEDGYKLVLVDGSSVLYRCEKYEHYNLKAYINSCSPLDFCKSEIFYEGLSAELTSVFSCHVCKNTAHIPVAGVRLDQAKEKIVGLR